MNENNPLKKFWHFLKQDTWQSWIVSLILLVVIIKFILFPTLSLVTGTQLPFVVVQSCSMYHGTSFDDWWRYNGEWYVKRNITKSEFESFTLKDGFAKGDVIFVIGRTQPKIGDVIIFQTSDSTAPYPVIHRVVSQNPYQTKGDHNQGQLQDGNNAQGIDERNIPPSAIVGKSVFKIPFVGWIKLIFFEPFRPASERGFCH